MCSTRVNKYSYIHFNRRSIEIYISSNITILATGSHSAVSSTIYSFIGSALRVKEVALDRRGTSSYRFLRGGNPRIRAGTRGTVIRRMWVIWLSRLRRRTERRGQREGRGISLRTEDMQHAKGYPRTRSGDQKRARAFDASRNITESPFPLCRTCQSSTCQNDHYSCEE